jgi:subtilisin family serine protease
VAGGGRVWNGACPERGGSSVPEQTFHLIDARRREEESVKQPKQYRLHRELCLCLLALWLAAGPFALGARAHRRPLSLPKLARELLARARGAGAQERVNVIVQLKGSPEKGLDSLVAGLGGRVTRRFRRLDAQVVSLPARAAAALAAREEVRFVSPDRAVAAAGHVTTTTGTDAARVQVRPGLLGLLTTTTLDGSGVGIAVVDSGIDGGHESFQGGGLLGGGSRVVASRDFTGEGRTDDPYGHGTHVASIAAGSGDASDGAYTGVAPRAKLLNLRVLNAEGRGTVSGVLAALDWALTYRALYNIRVVNLSLGTPAADPYWADPLCQAVRRLSDAGVVVVAAAGNNGKDTAGYKVYGQVHSPGHEPSAITVGAANTFGTDARSDDAVTSYSSRGPSRGHWTDEAGVRRYDNLLKPDLVAPGNKVVGAAAAGNRLLAEHPELAHGASTPSSRRMMYLSGSSMATPAVAGAAALLLQDSPGLTPSLVKAILMLTAQPLAGFNTFEQGAGLVNVEGAVRLGYAVRDDLSAQTPLGAPLLASPLPATSTTLVGETFYWSQGLVMDHTFVTGEELLTRYQIVYGLGYALGEGLVKYEQHQTVHPSRMTEGVVVGESILSAAGTTLDAGSFFLAAGLLLGGGTLLGDGVMVGDGVVAGDGIMVGDGVMVGDTDVTAQSALVVGDETPPAP